MLKRNTILIIDNEGDILSQITNELREYGYHTLQVEDIASFIPLLDSMDRIYTIVFVDRDFSIETLPDRIRILKQFAPRVPIVFVSVMSTQDKEKVVRENGVFFYYVNGDGMTMLIEAVRAAMGNAILKNTFIPSLDNM